MKSITIRMTDEMHKILKLKTVSDEKSIQEYIMTLIEEDMKKAKTQNKL